MPLKYNCANCGAEIITKYLVRGDSLTCRFCNNEIIVPQTATETDERPQFMPADRSESAPKSYPQFFQEDFTVRREIGPPAPTEWGVGSIIRMFFATLGVLIVFSCLVGAIIGIALSPYYGTDSPEAYDYLDRILKVFEPIFNIAFVIIPMVLIYFSLTRRHHQNFFDILRIHPISWKDGRRYIALGSGVAVIVIAVGVLIELIGFGYLIPDDMPITEEIQGGYGQMIFFTIMALLAGVTEEIINRGYIFQGLRHTWDQRAAAIIVTAFFILMHWPQLGYAITPLLFIVPIAVIFMMIRIKRDSLSYCMITHMSYNGTLLLLVWSYVLITGEPISAA